MEVSTPEVDLETPQEPMLEGGGKADTGEQRAIEDEILGIGGALRAAAEQLERQTPGAVARYTRDAADALERLGNSLKHKNLSEAFSDLEHMARDRPAVAAGLSALVGFLGARGETGATEQRKPTQSQTGGT